VISVTRTLALELAPHRIRVNAIAPDICLTEGLEAMVPPNERARWTHLVPLGRPADPDDIAGAAVFLVSDLSRYVTGITLHVDGGTHAAGGWYRDPADGTWVLDRRATERFDSEAGPALVGRGHVRLEGAPSCDGNVRHRGDRPHHARRGGRPYGLTVFAALSLSPPLLVICIDKKAETHPHFFDSRCFVVNILAADQAELSSHFAKSGGDKFGSLPFRVNQDGVPVLEGTLAHVECRIIATHEGGDHVIHIGEVQHAETRGGRPLLFFQGKYHRLDD
jgi:flavin reductase (DIM6/NTAB) family NADH-FMN oxidoreductase RutF